MKTVKTPAGIFTINKVKIPSAYTCAAEQKIEYISENHVQIITMNQAVSFGDQILSPRICQSCMNPEKITIYPLEIEYFGEKVFFKDHYSVKEWKKGDPLPEIHEWYGEHVQLICKDIRVDKKRIITRDFLADVYRKIRSILREPRLAEDVKRLLTEGTGFDAADIDIALAVFEELRLISRYNFDGEEFYQFQMVNKKMDLLSSSVYRRHMR